MKNSYMRGDSMKNKSILILAVAFLALSLLFGCTADNFQVVDGPGMVYNDSDYRTEYANTFDFDSYEGQPYFAVAFLGYGDRAEFSEFYVKGIFEGLSDESIEKIEHFDFEGDEWYLVIPRYKNDVWIVDLDTNETHTVHNGVAFTVKCNLSDLHSNIEIHTEDGYGAYMFSPQIGGDGRVVTNTDVHDITDYSVMEEISYIQGGE